MSLILKRITLISAHYSDNENYQITGYLLESRKGVWTIVNEFTEIDTFYNKKYLVLLLVSGYGVITKKAETSSSKEVIDNIINNNDTFYYNISSEKDGERVDFIRNTQIQSLKQVFIELRIPICDIKLLSTKENPDNKQIINIIQEFVLQNLTLKNIIKPSERNSAITLSIYNRFRNPVLTVVFIVLLTSLLSKNYMDKKNNALAVEVGIIQKELGDENNLVKQKNELFQEFDKCIEWKFCWLCDRIAGTVTDGMSLHNLSIQKLIKKLENNKSIELQSNVIIVSGSAANSDLVSVFMEDLKKESFVKRITLLSTIKSKETALFNFTIELII